MGCMKNMAVIYIIYVLKLTRNKEEAEDLMQDVWVKVVRYS